MAGFAEILSGIGDAAREDRLRKQHEEEVHSKGLGDIISQQIQDPNLTEEERGQLQQTLFGLASGKTKAKQAGELALKTLIKMNAQPKAAPVSGPVDPNVASTPQAAPVLAPPPAALRALLQLAPPPPQTASAMPLGGLPDPWGQPSAGLETLLSSQAETAPQAQPQPGVLPPPPGQPTPEPAMQPESRFWETMNTGYRAGSVGDKAVRAKAQQEWQHMRMIADAQERAAKEKEDREYARRLKELAEIEKSTGKQFNPVQRANFLHGQRLEEFPTPPPEVKPNLQRFEGALAGEPNKKVLVVWNPKDNTFSVGGIPVAANQIVPPSDVGSVESVPAQERKDALEAYAVKANRKIGDLGPQERIQAVVDFKAQTAPVFSSSGFALVPQPDGSIAAVPITRTTSKSFPGTGIPPPPGGGGGGQPTATPKTVAKAGAGGGSGAPGRIVGGRELSQEIQRLKGNAESGLKALAQMRAELKRDPQALLKEPFGGSRVFTAAKREAVDVITRLRTGAALNMSEEQFYKDQFPNWKDYLIDPKAVEFKLKMYEDLFNRFNKGGATAAPGGPKLDPAGIL